MRDEAAALDGDVVAETDAFVEDPADVLVRVSEHFDLPVSGSRATGLGVPSCWVACRTGCQPRRNAR